MYFNRTRSEIFNLIKKHSITHISATPTFYRLLLPYERAYSSVIRLTLGGKRVMDIFIMSSVRYSRQLK